MTAPQFEAQLRLLQRAGFESITFAEYLDFRAGRRSLPRRPILLTFDDGYRSVFDTAHPLLSRFGFRATVFVVSRAIGGTNGWDPDEAQVPLLSAGEIESLGSQGIEFQSHTRTHARLTALPASAALAELRDSRLDLESLLGAPVRAICYPYAAHSPSVEMLAKEAGYTLGVTIRRRLNRDDTNPLALRRIAVTYETSLARFGWDLVRLRLHGD